MIDLVCSTVPGGLAPDDIVTAKRAAFHVILAEERGRLKCDAGMIERIEREIGGKER